MENVVRFNFANKLNSERFTGINGNTKLSANNSVIPKIYEREAEEYCRLN